VGGAWLEQSRIARSTDRQEAVLVGRQAGGQAGRQALAGRRCKGIRHGNKWCLRLAVFTRRALCELL